MIFISEPYFNEPGYESARGHQSGQVSSATYSAAVRGNTLKHALLPALKCVPAEFDAVLRPYFALRAGDLERLALTWSRHPVASNSHDMAGLAAEVSRRLGPFRQAPEQFDLN